MKTNKFARLMVLVLALNASSATRAMQLISGGSTGSGSRLRSVPRAASIFVFHSDEFWLNLHHFLYVLGRAANKTRDASREAVVHAAADQDNAMAILNPQEQKIWREAVAAYAAGLSQKDLIFDDPLPAIANALARAGHANSLTRAEIDPAIVAILTRAAPIYRKAWWTRHRAANQAWQTATQSLVKQRGATILAFVTHVFQMEWPPAGYNVHITGYANWAGAYSTEGNLLVLSSLDAQLQGPYGLETVFHEGMHQWDDQLSQALNEQARLIGKPVPVNLSHALIFFTAGEAVRRVIPEHVRYADKFGMWQRGWTRERDALEEIWKPYLEGSGTRDEAFAGLIKRLAT